MFNPNPSERTELVVVSGNFLVRFTSVVLKMVISQILTPSIIVCVEGGKLETKLNHVGIVMQLFEIGR